MVRKIVIAGDGGCISALAYAAEAERDILKKAAAAYFAKEST